MLQNMAELASVREKKNVFLLLNRAFATLWRGQAISTPGNDVLNTTRVLWIATAIARTASRAPLAVSDAFLAASVATAVMGRCPPRCADWSAVSVRTHREYWGPDLVFADHARSHRPADDLPFSIFGAARLAVPDDLVDEQSRDRVTANHEKSGYGLWSFAGHPALWRPGCATCLLIDAFSFVVSWSAVFFAGLEPSLLRASQNFTPSCANSSAESIFTGNIALTTLFLATFLLMLGAGGIQALEIFFVTQNLRTAPVFSGLLSAVQGRGACSS